MAYERVTVYGFTGFKGVMDDGKAIDSGKVFVLRALNTQRNGEGSFKVGQFTQEFPLGSMAAALAHCDPSKPWLPQEMEVDFQLVSDGKRSQVIVAGLRRIQAKAA